MKRFCIFGVIFLLLGSSVVSAQLLPLKDLVRVGCERSRVIMMNEGHSGLLRIPRTRRLGRQMLGDFYRHGVRVLTLEALDPETARQANRSRVFPEYDIRVGYLGQPEMRDFLQTALDLGMQLNGYEAKLDEYRNPSQWFDHRHYYDPSIQIEPTDAFFGGGLWNRFREQNQAQHLLEQYKSLAEGEKMLVWCGNGHLSKKPLESLGPYGGSPYWLMGRWFVELSGIQPFCISQTTTANWPGEGLTSLGRQLLERHSKELQLLPQRSAGLLVDDGLSELSGSVDAVVVSLENDFE